MSDSTTITKLSPSESIKILITLVETAHKRGTFTLPESYLAFNAIHTFTEDKSFDNVLNYIKDKYN